MGTRDTQAADHEPVAAEPQSPGAGLAPSSAATVLDLQRRIGNRGVRRVLAAQGVQLARKEKVKTRLARLDELLGKFNVDEGAVIAHLGTLDDNEKRIVLRDYRKRIADPLNACEMVRAVKLLGGSLPTKLSWVSAAGTPDYGDIRGLITDSTVPQTERNALATNGWRDWFVKVCTNSTMRDAVVDLKFDVRTKIEWLRAEGTDAGLFKSAMAVAPRAEIVTTVKDSTLMQWIATEMGAEYATAIDRVLIEKARADGLPDFKAAVDQIPENRLNDLDRAKSWLEWISADAGHERFAYLAARIMLISKYAPAARTEALRVTSTELLDRSTALRMIANKVQVVIVPRGKKMTELAEFAPLLTSDSGKGPGKTFDGREWASVRGVGNVSLNGRMYAAITEENLLGGVPAAAVGEAATPSATRPRRTSSPTSCTGTGSARSRRLISKHYNRKRKATETKDTLTLADVWPDGPRISPTAPADWAAARGPTPGGWRRWRPSPRTIAATTRTTRPRTSPSTSRSSRTPTSAPTSAPIRPPAGRATTGARGSWPTRTPRCSRCSTCSTSGAP